MNINKGKHGIKRLQVQVEKKRIKLKRDRVIYILSITEIAIKQELTDESEERGIEK